MCFRDFTESKYFLPLLKRPCMRFEIEDVTNPTVEENHNKSYLFHELRAL